MLRHFQIRAVQIRLVTTGAGDSRTRIIGNDQPAGAVEELEGTHMAMNPVRQSLIGCKARKRVSAGSKHCDKQRCWTGLAGWCIVNRNGWTGPIDEHLVAG